MSFYYVLNIDKYTQILSNKSCKIIDSKHLSKKISQFIERFLKTSAETVRWVQVGVS